MKQVNNMVSARSFELVIGAGPVARHLTSKLVAEGRSVTLLSRKPTTDLPGSARNVVADVLNVSEYIDAVRGATVVYSAVNAPYTRWAEELPPLMRTIATLAASLDARLVAMDNLYMLDPAQGPMRWDSPIAPRSKNGEVRAAVAEELMSMANRGGAPTALLRASDFFGPTVTKAHLSMCLFADILDGKAAKVVGNPSTLHSYSYIEDVAAALATLGAHDRSFGRVWHTPGASATTTRALLERAAGLAGRKLKVLAAPRWMVGVGAWFDPTLQGLTEMLYQFESDFVMDSSDFIEAFGDISTPLDIALQTTLDAARLHRPVVVNRRSAIA